MLSGDLTTLTGYGIDDLVVQPKPEVGNIISGNNGAGVVLSGVGTDNNTLEGNFVGLNLAGDTAIANTDSGVLIEAGAANNSIGGSTAAARNVISGNTVDGIRLDGAGTDNQISGNYIGSNSAGDASLANGTVGVHLLNASHGTVIGTNGDGIGDAGEGNLITGQGSGDIGVSINDSDNTIVAGNIIGLNAAGDTALFAALNQRGVRIEDSIGTRIGTDADGTSDTEERNVIAGQRGNQGIGIEIRSGTSATKIAGNYLGTDITGTVAIVTGGVNRTGVFINENGGGAVIGGSTPAERNIIGGQQRGISFRLGSNNKVQGNYIGIGADGDTVVGNTYGYWAQDPSNFNIIGTDGDGVNDATEGNVISGNQTGVHTFGGFGVVIAGNIVGLDPTGTVAKPNTTVGLDIRTFDPRIGTDGNGVSDEFEGNVISGNNGHGLRLGRQTEIARNAIIAGNYIGTNAAGTSAIPNVGDAISLDDVTDGTIGGDIAVERNIVVGSGNVGLSVIGGSTGHELLDNFFGTDINGVPIGGQTEAIDVSDGSVFVNGTIDAAEGVTVAATGILGGIGTINGDVVNNGIVAPGNSPGVLTTGSFTFADNSTYEAELGGDTAGNNANNHDQIDVMGTVTIGNNVTLSAINFNSYAPSSGDQLVIINNDGSDPVSGTFAGLPEGAFVVDDAMNNYVITYVGGDGNDVVLNATGGATFTVINTNDSGAGSLRQAILDANASAGPDAIEFDITSTEGAGPHTIAPVTLLPAITDAVIVNGLTETSASANTLTSR